MSKISAHRYLRQSSTADSRLLLRVKNGMIGDSRTASWDINQYKILKKNGNINCNLQVNWKRLVHADGGNEAPDYGVKGDCKCKLAKVREFASMYTLASEKQENPAQTPNFRVLVERKSSAETGLAQELCSKGKLCQKSHLYEMLLGKE